MSKATENFVEKCKRFYDEADKDGNGLQVGELAKMIRNVSSVPISDQEIAVSYNSYALIVLFGCCPCSVLLLLFFFLVVVLLLFFLFCFGLLLPLLPFLSSSS